jgi:hypothetical protein
MNQLLSAFRRAPPRAEAPVTDTEMESEGSSEGGEKQETAEARERRFYGLDEDEDEAQARQNKEDMRRRPQVYARGARELWSDFSRLPWQVWVMHSDDDALAVWNEYEINDDGEHFARLPMVHGLLQLLPLHRRAYEEHCMIDDDEEGSKRSHIRFVECFVGDYLTWRCRQMGTERFMTELHGMRVPDRARGFGGAGGINLVRPRDHPLMVACNVLRQLYEAKLQIIAAYDENMRRQQHARGMPQSLLEFHFAEGFSFFNQLAMAGDFELHSFGKWLRHEQKQQRG